jgi:chitinase
MNPDGKTTSGLLKSCPIITEGIPECKKNGKKVLLSLGGGYPTGELQDSVYHCV